MKNTERVCREMNESYNGWVGDLTGWRESEEVLKNRECCLGVKDGEQFPRAIMSLASEDWLKKSSMNLQRVAGAFPQYLYHDFRHGKPSCDCRVTDETDDVNFLLERSIVFGDTEINLTFNTYPYGSERCSLNIMGSMGITQFSVKRTMDIGRYANDLVRGEGVSRCMLTRVQSIPTAWDDKGMYSDFGWGIRYLNYVSVQCRVGDESYELHQVEENGSSMMIVARGSGETTKQLIRLTGDDYQKWKRG